MTDTKGINLDILCSPEAFDINPDIRFSYKSEINWYKNIVFYHIWLPSFNDSNNDGVGDINGVTMKLDYLKNLGIKAIWLSPFFECDYKGENMHGYDVTDFYNVNSALGNMDDLKNLVMQAHLRDIRLVFDFPMNHTSYKHPWFTNSSNGGSYKDYYVWNKQPGEGWHVIWDESRAKKTWHKHNDTHYYGVFHQSMPDLNYENIAVRNEMIGIMKFWLDFGFDGVRIDGVRYIFEDGPDSISDTNRTHRFFQLIKKELFEKYDKSGFSKVYIAEAWGSKEVIKEYYGDAENKEFDICFNFPLAKEIPQMCNHKSGSEEEINLTMKYQIENYPEKYIGGTFLTNHDLAGNRPSTDFNGNPKKILLSTAIQLFFPGTPFVYYGNELGMKNDVAKWDMAVRGKMKWELDIFNNEILSGYRKMIQLYNNIFADFKDTDFIYNGAISGLLSFIRIGKNKSCHFMFNYSDRSKKVCLDGSGKILINTDSVRDGYIELMPYFYDILVVEW